MQWLYSELRENAPRMFRALTSARASSLFAFLSFDLPVGLNVRRFLEESGVDFNECLDGKDELNTLRRIFERKIRYWESRPMPPDPLDVVAPADSRVLLGSLSGDSCLWIKGKLFDLRRLIAADRPRWLSAFEDGDYAVFRLTPEKYHYNHAPVSGRVEDFYEIPGHYHSCNPSALVSVPNPYSTNKRVVTIIDTDVPDGSQVGYVAMIEVVALMIGEIAQAYSETRYDDPRPVAEGTFLKKGQPKSLFRPGSSTVLLLFQKDRFEFAEDLRFNAQRQDVRSRFSAAFGQSLVETDIQVRSLIGRPTRPRS